MGEADERKQINVPAGNTPKNYQTYAAKLRSEDKSHKISTCIDPGRGNDKWDRDLYSVNTKQLIVAEKSEHSANKNINHPSNSSKQLTRAENSFSNLKQRSGSLNSTQHQKSQNYPIRNETTSTSTNKVQNNSKQQNYAKSELEDPPKSQNADNNNKKSCTDKNNDKDDGKSISLDKFLEDMQKMHDYNSSIDERLKY